MPTSDPINDSPPRKGRRDLSKYAELWEELHDPKQWEDWVHVDTVRGGGLAYRLKTRRYVGLEDLEFLVESHRAGDGRLAVWIMVTGRRSDT